MTITENQRVAITFKSHTEFGHVARVDENGIWINWNSIESAKPSGPYTADEIHAA